MDIKTRFNVGDAVICQASPDTPRYVIEIRVHIHPSEQGHPEQITAYKIARYNSPPYWANESELDAAP